MENKNWKNLSVIQTIKSNMGILAGLVILCVVLSFTTSSFATVTNLFNVVRQITINLFLACGMTFVILLAGIDLSVGSVMALSGMIMAIVMNAGFRTAASYGMHFIHQCVLNRHI